jgi:hypothetical protein
LWELRAALNAVYVAAGRNAPAYTPLVILATTTAVAAVQVAELRAALNAGW